MPKVEVKVSMQHPPIYLLIKHVFPTPESPSTIIFKYIPDEFLFFSFFFFLQSIFRNQLQFSIQFDKFQQRAFICYICLELSLRKFLLENSQKQYSIFIDKPYSSHVFCKFIIKQIYQMKKSKSFSHYGKNLQIRSSTRTNPEILMRNTKRANENQLKVEKPQKKWIQGFDRITGREKPNSFQVFNTRDFCRQANYDIKQQLVHNRNSFYPVRKQKQQRLNLLFTASNYQMGSQICRKHPMEQKKQYIMTAGDLHNLRKSHHSMDFNKQLTRSNSYIKKPVGTEHFQFENTAMSSNSSKMKEALLKNPMLKKVHSFDSYTKRDFLSQKKIAQKGAPFYSGAQSFKIPLQKYKGNWKKIEAQNFQKSPQKHLSRYDAINKPFYTKLGYHPKEELVTKKAPIFSIEQQTSRQINEVHSKYPIRLTI